MKANKNVLNRAGRIALLAAAAGLIGLSGCAGHGQYTKKGSNLAKQRLAMIKSGNEWEMAQQQFFANELDKALATIDHALEINPEYARAHLLRGRILMEKGDLNKARAAFEDAQKYDEKNAEPEYYLGVLHERFAEPAKALDCYTKAGQLDPTNAQYLIAGAEMLIQMDRLDDAEKLLNDNRSQFEYEPAVRQTLGHIALLRNDPKKAAELFNEALLLAPDDQMILEDLVQAQLACGQFAEAEFNINRLIEANKDTPRRDLKHMRVRCLMALDRPVEARTVLQDLVKDPEGEKDVRAWIELGNVSYILNDKRRLQEAATRVVALAPHRYEGYFLQGAWQRLDDKPQRALSSLDDAIRLAGNKAEGPLILKGFVLRDMGRADQARDAFSKAVALDPSNTRTRAMYEALTKGRSIVGVETDGPTAP